MNNSFKIRNSKEVTIQLNRADVQKNKLIKNIYKEYEIYFHIVRKSLLNSIEKGILSIYSDSSISDKIINSKELNIFLNKNISLLIHSKLPFITIEQLKLREISDTKNQIVNENDYTEMVKLKEYQTVDYENKLIVKDVFGFHSNNNSSTYGYYENLCEDESSSVNLDECDYLYSSCEQISIKKIEDEKHIVKDVLELTEETNNNKLNDNEKINDQVSDQVSDVFISSDNLNFFEFIDRSFINFLLDLSYKVNSELFKINLIPKIISDDTFKFLSNKNYIISHPYPFVLKYDLNSNCLLANSNKTSNIYLCNITYVELEFCNLDLSISRNNINELKNRFRLLNKKQRYWKNKEIASNSPK